MSDLNQENAFGGDFEAALAAAFATEGKEMEKSEPAAVEPEVVLAQEDEPEATTTDPIAENTEETVETDDDDSGIELPIDEDPQKEEPAEEEETVDTTGMTKAAGARFKELRVELKAEKKARIALEQKAAQAEARLKELEGTNSVSEELKQKLEAYESELMLSRLESTEAYRTTVTEPLKEVAETADAIALKYEINADEILDALALTDQTAQDEAFEVLLAGVAERDKLKIYALAEKLPSIFEQRQMLHEKREQALAEIDARNAERAKQEAAQRAEERKKATEFVLKRVEAKLPFIKTIGGVDLKAIKEQIDDTDLESLDMANKSYNAFSGRALPKLAAAYKAALDEIEQLTNDLDTYRRSTPGVGARGASPAPSGTADPGVAFTDAVERAFASIR